MTQEIQTVNIAICSACKGRCCKTVPGAWMPDQICSDGADMESAIRSEIESGRSCVDWWEGDPRIEANNIYTRGPYLRPRTKEARNDIKDPTCGGECSLLTEKGCILNYADRPKECQKLIPNKSFNCSTTEEISGKQKSAIAWWPYRDIIWGVTHSMETSELV